MKIQPVSRRKKTFKYTDLQEAPLTRQPEATEDSLPLDSRADALPPLPPKKWTVLLYMGAHNDLETSLAKNLIDLEKVGSNEEINLVAEIDRGPEPDLDCGGRPHSTRYYITKDNDDQHINSPILQKMGPTDSGSPQTLENFLDWGIKKYPAQNYLIMLNDHGAGFWGVVADDESGESIPLPALNRTLQKVERQNGVSKDRVVLGFDACLMAQAEVAYEVKDAADFMIASEASMGINGLPYSAIFGQDKVADLNNAQMASTIVRKSNSIPDTVYTLAAVDLKEMDKVKEGIEQLAEALLETKESKMQINSIIRNTHGFYGLPSDTRPYPDYRDLYHLAEKLAGQRHCQDENLIKASRDLMAAIERAVPEKTYTYKERDAHGLSIYTSLESEKYEKYQHRQMQLAKDTKWEKAMCRFKLTSIWGKNENSSQPA